MGIDQCGRTHGNPVGAVNLSVTFVLDGEELFDVCIYFGNYAFVVEPTETHHNARQRDSP